MDAVRRYLEDFDTDELVAELKSRKSEPNAIPAIIRMLKAEGFEVVEPVYPPSTAAAIANPADMAAWRARAGAAKGAAA